jgi:hypothetical protein
MMHKRIAAFSVALVLVLASFTTAAAAPPQTLHIEQDWTIANSSAPFTAEGAAVTSGLVCATGIAENLSNVSSGAAGGTLSILHVVKRFTCADLSGTFDIALTVQLDNVTHYTTARWRIVGGTGSYSSLRGRGSLAGTPIIPGVSIHDVYDGTAN